MVASAKKSKVGLDLDHNILSKARITTDAFSSAGTGEVRYDTSTEQFAWWTSGGSEKKVTDIPLSSFTATNTSDLDLDGFKITNLGTPTNASDGATKGYVDSVAQGLDAKDSVRVMSDSDIATLSGTTTIDGVLVVVDDRVLLKGQTTASENGIWVVKAGVWIRPSDFFTGSDVASAYMWVEEGTSYADTGWLCTNDVGLAEVDTDNLSFTQFSGAGTILAGNGLTKTGNTIDVISANTGILVNANDIELNLASGSGLEISSGLKVASTIAGNGLTLTSGVLDVGSGLGITSNANDIQIKLDTTLGANLFNVFSLISNGLSIKLDDSTIGANISNQIFIKNGGVTETQINTSSLGNGLQGGSGTVISVKVDTVGGTNLARSINTSSNGVAVKIDDVTIGENGSNRLYVKNNSINENILTTSVAGNGLTGGNGTALAVLSNTIGGANLAKVVDVGVNGVAVKIDDVTIGENGSNRLYVKNNSINENMLTASVAGNGLTGGNGTALAVNVGTGLTIVTDTVQIDTAVVPRRYAVSIGDGSTTDIVVTHNLGTRDVIVQIWETSGAFEEVIADVELTSINTITARFTVAPTTNQYRVVVLG